MVIEKWQLKLSGPVGTLRLQVALVIYEQNSHSHFGGGRRS